MILLDAGFQISNMTTFSMEKSFENSKNLNGSFLGLRVPEPSFVHSVVK